MAGETRCRIKELPLDIFKTLLDNVINTIGIAEGARLRTICQLFDQEVPGALFRNPQFNHFHLNYDPSRQPALEQYVLYRTLADGKRYPNISARLHRILKDVLPGGDYSSNLYQDAIRSLVTTAVYQDRCDVYHVGPMDDTKKFELQGFTFRGDCVRAIAMLGVSGRFAEVIDYASGSDKQIHRLDYGIAAFHGGPLVYATIGGQYQLIVRILDARKAASRISDDYEVTDAYRAAIEGGFIRIVKLLLRRYPRQAQPSLACLAARTNQIEIFKLLCPILNLPLGDFAFLTEAAGSGHVEVVRFCLEHGASPVGDDVPWDELAHLRIPIQVACSRGYRNVVRLLLEYGANASDEQERRQALTAAASGGYWRLVQDLLAAGAVACHHPNYSPLIRAVRNGQAKVVEVLLDSGIELWYKDWALCRAARAGYDTIVRLLVERGAKIDAAGQYSPTNPMLEAMINGQQHVVRTLLELGAKPAGPFPISDHTGVLEKWKYPRVERPGMKSGTA